MANKINPFDHNVNSELYNVHFPNFAFWLQKTQPLVYDDALSYYEVLCRISAMLNQLIKQVNDLTDAQKQFIKDATELLNKIIENWNNIVDEFNSMKSEFSNIKNEFNSMKNEFNQWKQLIAQWTTQMEQWGDEFNNWRNEFNAWITKLEEYIKKIDDFIQKIENEWNDYKNEINNIITNFENEVNEKIKDFVTVGILEHVVTYGGIWEQFVTLEAGASTRILLPESMQKDGLYFLANASIDCEGIIVNVDKWTVVAYNASTQTRNPNLQVYALGEFGVLSR